MVPRGADETAEREERLAHNEVIFRALNERIANHEVDLAPGTLHEFVCECATAGCFERISLTRAQYELIRDDGTHFLLARGHEDIEVEQIVASNDALTVVEKDGPAGIIALDEDPRA